MVSHPPVTEPGRNLALIHRNLAGNPFLKHLLLKHCRHRAIPMAEVPKYHAMFRTALHATVDDWRSAEWIRATMKPVAELLDGVETTRWQQREPVARVTAPPGRKAVDGVIRATTGDLLRAWARDSSD